MPPLSQENEFAFSTILIVDDQPANLTLLQRVLQKHGFENVHTLDDSRQVADTLEAIDVDLILLDIRMPHIDGFGILTMLNERFGNDHLPVLVLTAQTDDETRDMALELGANDFLRKPFDAVEVVLRVKNMLKVRHRYREESSMKSAYAELVDSQSAQLADLLLEVVRRLGRAAEYRDNETGLHIVRMSKVARLVSERLGFNQMDATNLEYAATMHDIGKISTPDNILLKPGKLTEEEFGIMKQHTVMGASLLVSTRYRLLQLASEIALCHHEKFDGSGYPNGIKGDEIPLHARIVAVADVFDALTSERPYKKGWTVEQAVELICDSSGTHFDPQVVDAFMDVLPKVIEIKNTFADPVVIP